MSDLARELRDEYPAVDVTTVVFSRDFAGIACCVIPQDKVLAVIGALDSHADLVKALENARRYILNGDCLRIIDDALAKAALATLTARKVG